MASRTTPERFLDASNELREELSVIDGHSSQPLISLKDAVVPIKSWLHDADNMVKIARRDCAKSALGLDHDEWSAIYLFTMQWPHPHPSLSTLLNDRLRASDRERLRPWLPFFKLLLTALHKHPFTKPTVYRGARGNLSDAYEGERIWWGVTSCVASEEQVEQLIGHEGVRTMFVIECLRARCIQKQFCSSGENEILLLPGSCFEVVNKTNPSADLYVIHLCEKIIPFQTVVSPFDGPFTSMERRSRFTIRTVTRSSPSGYNGNDDRSTMFSGAPPPQVPVNQHSGAPNTIARRSLPDAAGERSTRIGLDRVVHSASHHGRSLSNSLLNRLRSIKTNGPSENGPSSPAETVTFGSTSENQPRTELPPRVVLIAGGPDQVETERQLSLPEGVFVDENDNVYIADCWNHRLMRCNQEDRLGTIIAAEDASVSPNEQLRLPSDVVIDLTTRAIIIADQGNRRVVRWLGQTQQVIISDVSCYGLAMDKHGFLYVSDYQNNEVIRWKDGEAAGTRVVGGADPTRRRKQLNYPTYICVDDDQSVYVSDALNDCVVKWASGATEGVVVAGGNGHGNSLNQLLSPRGVLVNRQGYIYVADSGNHRLVRWKEGEQEGTLIEDPMREQANALVFPTGLAFDKQGNLYVTDQGNHRVLRYDASIL